MLIGDAFKVLRYGSEVANVEAWKKGTVTGGLVTGLLGAIVGVLRSFGVALPIDDAQLASLGAALVTVGGVIVSVITAATSKRAGLPGTDRRTDDVARVASEPAPAPAPRPEQTRSAGSAVDASEALQRLRAGAEPQSADDHTNPFRDSGT